jgi:NADPH2:quinone reductase
MKAIGTNRHLPVTDPECLVWFEAPEPVVGPRDLLVKIEAIAVNPVDTKIRKSLGAGPLPELRILGWDAAGTVVSVGSEVSGFQPGDEVFYAGDVTRPGCNAPLQSVDERLVAHKPLSIGFSEAASWPLVAITAWELLFERMRVDVDGSDAGKPLLIINGAGGVGSVLIQLAKRAGLRVIATASRSESIAWCRKVGADEVINHHQPLAPQLASLGITELPLIINLHLPDLYWKQTSELIAPFGTLGLIVEPSAPVHAGDPMKMKCATVVWEWMFARNSIARIGFSGC